MPLRPIRSRDATSEADGRERDRTAPPPPEPLPLDVPDNHTHLDVADGQERSVEDLLGLARAAGVGRAVQIGCDLEAARWTRELLDAQHPGPDGVLPLLGGVAIHPNEAAALDDAGLDAALAEVEALLDHPRMRVVGETGLDHFRTPPEGRAQQEESFRRHIDLARRTGLALQVHDRDAHDDVVRVLLDEGAPERTVFHCFSGDVALARTAAEHGWYCSFAGVLTFRNAAALREACAVLPSELLLVETDAPFLTPHPYRGRPNASYLMPHTVRAMAEARGADLVDLCATLVANSERVYGSWGDPATNPL
ncbi:TatD family hydrolase [Aquipuribacter sp. SD81]|uniref:TatD family hydrolase n=1 Tax=Aquipuribacter sp. SD81 TaxID=3127703 RepID=UPI003FA60025